MIYNEDCITGSAKIQDESCDLLICDPPFGIGETSFHRHYKRDETTVIQGYQEAPADYLDFSIKWIKQAKRVMKANGSLYIVSGWSKLLDILKAVEAADLHLINHIVWKFNFGIATKTKFVTSHYHILYLKKSEVAKPKFNTYCRFGMNDRTDKGGSLLYQDMEDVWWINKDYQPGQVKNKNKLPDDLILKMIQYSSDPGDIVCDFFLGNFTTAMVAKRYGRIPCGFELNQEAYDYWTPRLNAIETGCDLPKLRVVENSVPENQGKPITPEEVQLVKAYYQEHKTTKTKKQIISDLQERLKRGRFAVLNILDKA